jgi:hypothetical protein
MPKKLAGAAVVVKVAIPQLSVAVGAVQDTVVPHVVTPLVTVILAGMPAMMGFWLSTTVTVKDPVVVLLLLSRAVYVTVVTPLGKELPGAALEVKLMIPQASAAVGTVQETGAAHVPVTALTVMLAGILVNVGTMASTTVTS